MAYLLTLSIVFSVLDIYFGNPRGFMLFPKFQIITWFTFFLLIASTVLFEKEWLESRHSINLTGMLKLTVPKAIICVFSVILMFFSIYLNMVTEYSA